MNKKPEIFKPNMDFIDNNEKAYVSFLHNRDSKINTNDLLGDVTHGDTSLDVVDYINALSHNGYVFNKRVVIVTKNRTYDTRIAGKIGNRIITLDNDSINIDDIVKIYEK